MEAHNLGFVRLDRVVSNPHPLQSLLIPLIQLTRLQHGRQADVYFTWPAFYEDLAVVLLCDFVHRQRTEFLKTC